MENKLKRVSKKLHYLGHYYLRQQYRKFSRYLLTFYIHHLYNPKACHFKDLRTMVLSIGFPRSGSSIMGFLLTAHPNIVMADEGKLKLLLDKNIELLNRPNEIIYYFLRMDRSRYLSWKISFDEDKMEHNRRGHTRAKRYVNVSSQYQGRFKKLHVIGNKNRGRDVNFLANTSLLKHLRSKLEDNKISLKFIFNIRDLYDIVAADFEGRGSNDLLDIDLSIKDIAELCENNQKILEQIDSSDVFICKNEDLIANPKLQITKLCDFLKVSASADYINACASRVINKPTNSRFKIDWSDQHKEKINSLIKKYDFLYSYDF